ncbi:MAG: 2-C-methyl-D-erythritol 4-phosphate cytidylyltransferase [Erysipelotrichaceae bacterium]|nr:2-C-methyl-D-erythritol 4-phosphate cytidylyltransferase [Erysipelotrichaceae bacterium]
MKYSTVIVAAGSGTRMGLGYNKVYHRINGKTILEMTMETFLNDEDCLQIVVVTDASDYMREITSRWPGKIVLAKGGSTRQESVSNGLHAVLCDVVMIHDGARPYVHKESLDELKKTMETEQAACLCVPCKDTIKVLKDGYIVETPDRSALAAAQTPQVFHTDVILDCMHKAFREGFTGTDDASLAERYGIPVKAVTGTYDNIKITTAEDLK